MMLEAYFDESGIQRGAKVCVIAGYYATQSSWRHFEKIWRKTLVNFGIKDGFHAKEFWGRDGNGNRVGQYEKWSDKKSVAFLESLIKAVEHSKIFPCANGVVIGHWNSLPLDDRRWLSAAKWRNGKFRSSGSPNKPYYLPFHFCVFDPARHVPRVEEVNYFFGLDNTFSKYALDLYKRFLADPEIECRDKLGQISFPLSKNTPPLQAADLLSYQIYQHSMARFLGNGITPVPPIVRRLMKRRQTAIKLRLLTIIDLRKLLELSANKRKT